MVFKQVFAGGLNQHLLNANRKETTLVPKPCAYVMQNWVAVPPWFSMFCPSWRCKKNPKFSGEFGPKSRRKAGNCSSSVTSVCKLQECKARYPCQRILYKMLNAPKMPEGIINKSTKKAQNLQTHSTKGSISAIKCRAVSSSAGSRSGSLGAAKIPAPLPR